MFNSIKQAFTNRYVLWAIAFITYLLALTAGADVGKLLAQLVLLLGLLGFSGLIYVVLGRSGKDLTIAALLFVFLAAVSYLAHFFDLAGGIGYALGSVVQGVTIAGTCIVLVAMAFILAMMILISLNTKPKPQQSPKQN